MKRIYLINSNYLKKNLGCFLLRQKEEITPWSYDIAKKKDISYCIQYYFLHLKSLNYIFL